LHGRASSGLSGKAGRGLSHCVNASHGNWFPARRRAFGDARRPVRKAERDAARLRSRVPFLTCATSRKAIDGELRDLDKTTEIKSHPGALKVLVPAVVAVAGRAFTDP
jgi:hypothetical protein